MAYGIRFGYGILLPVMIKDLEMSVGEAGLIYSGYFLAYAFIAPVVGSLTDRVGGRYVITLFCGILGFGTLIMGSIHQWQAGFASAVIMGAGASATWTPVVTVISKWFGTRWRGKALGILVTGYGWGFGAMGLLLPLMVAWYGWRFCWQFLAAMALLSMLINGFLLRSKPEDLGFKPWGGMVEVSKSKRPKVGVYQSIFKGAGFWLMGLSYFTISFATYTAMLYLVSYANLELGIEYAVAAMLASIVAFSGIPGGLAIPALSDYLGRRAGIVLCNAMVMLTLFGFVGLGSNLYVLMATAAIFGVFYSAIWPIYAAYVADYFPREVTGTVIGLWTINYGVGAMLSSAVAGYLHDITQTFFWPFMLASFMAGLSIILVFISKLRLRD
jgi:MFS family permease